MEHVVMAGYVNIVGGRYMPWLHLGMQLITPAYTIGGIMVVIRLLSVEEIEHSLPLITMDGA